MEIFISFSGIPTPIGCPMGRVASGRRHRCTELENVDSKQPPMMECWTFYEITPRMAVDALEELCTFENIRQIIVGLQRAPDCEPVGDEVPLFMQFIEGLAGLKNLDALCMTGFNFRGAMTGALAKLQCLRVFSLEFYCCHFDRLSQIALKDAILMMPRLQEFTPDSCTLRSGSEMSTAHLFGGENTGYRDRGLLLYPFDDGSNAIVISPLRSRSASNGYVCRKIMIFNIIPNPCPARGSQQESEDRLSTAISNISDSNAQTVQYLLLRNSPFAGGRLTDLSPFRGLRSLSIINCGLLVE